MATWLAYAYPTLSLFSPAKPSRPSRAYIHVVSNEHVGPLSDQVRQSSFQDASHTSNDPVLLGPPTLEFAPYAKTPGSRVRKDARQGTIDQDPEFIAFLESLTQPITKPVTVDSIEAEEKKAAVVTTPLVQFIKDKKASKAKESAAAKSSKRSEKESKQEKVQAKKLLQRPEKKLAPGPSSDEKPKGEKAGKESSKAAKAAKAAAGTSTKGGKASASSTTKENTSAAASERKRERGNVAAAAKILQRDLGLSQAPARRRGKGGANDTASTKNESSRESSVPASEGSKKEAPSKPAKSAASSTKAKDREGGVSPSSRASGTATPPVNAPTASTKSAKGAKAKATASPTPTATQAFLKHANASQGVTEALLEAAFTPFGTVTKVEIDKKKGFGYVDFAEPEGLQKAMAASPVSVAQSQVVVLERKANPGGEKSRKGGGGGGGGRGDTSQQAKGEKAKASASAKDGENANGGGGAGGGGSSRGSRGGRGSRNKGAKGGDGSKGGSSSGTGGGASGEKSGGEAK